MDAKNAAGEPTAYISRSALLHNAALIRRQLAPQTKICAIIKADAYGHGAAIVADTLANFSTGPSLRPTVDAFAVADLDEAEKLPPLPQPILILRPIENAFVGQQKSRIKWAIQNNCWLTLTSPTAADDVARIAMASGRRAHIHIMLDTGMNRGGIRPEHLHDLLRKISSRPSLRLAGLYTHFASSEDAEHPLTIEQLAAFLDRTDSLCDSGASKILRHAANSGAIFFTPPAHLNMVRPGISLYGIDPTGCPSLDRPLRPVLRWTAPLIAIRDVKKGESAGYNQTWMAPRDTRLGLVPIGYADGYCREFSNRATMLLHDSPAPVVGRVSMDLTTLDLSQIPMSRLGDEVTVLDNNPLSPASAYKLAEWAHTIPYEIFCRIGQRIRRVAVDPVENDSTDKMLTQESEEESDDQP